MGSPESFPVEPVDLGPFFEEDGNIYGYQGLKVLSLINLNLCIVKKPVEPVNPSVVKKLYFCL